MAKGDDMRKLVENEAKAKRYRIFRAETGETILYLWADEWEKVSHWIGRTYGDTDEVDFEEA